MMYWYHWVAVYLLIIGCALFVIIPDKSWEMWLITGGCIAVSILLGLLLPHKPEPPYPPNKNGS